MNELLIYAKMLDSLVLAYIQFVIMPLELKKVLSQELKCLFVCVARLSQFYPNEPHQNTMDMILLHFYCIRNK
jgi:hypothetical protein